MTFEDGGYETNPGDELPPIEEDWLHVGSATADHHQETIFTTPEAADGLVRDTSMPAAVGLVDCGSGSGAVNGNDTRRSGHLSESEIDGAQEKGRGEAAVDYMSPMSLGEFSGLPNFVPCSCFAVGLILYSR